MIGKFASSLASACMLCACSHTGSITRTSSDYNKAMADVRNQQLLLNIMRAAAREPLQFSAMGDINTTFDRTAGLDSNFNNFLAGTPNAITQALKLSGGNKPVVNIKPLSHKEFIAGILRPTTPETLKQFMDLGWDAEFMLPLLVRGYRCPNATSFTWLSGKNPELQAIVSKLSLAALGAQWSTVKTPGKPIELQVADDKALEMLRSGISAGYKVESVKPSPEAGKSIVKLTSAESTTSSLQLALCGTPPVQNVDGSETGLAANEAAKERLRSQDAKPPELTTFTVVDHSEATPAPVPPPVDANRALAAKGQIVFRSAEGVIYFLGQRLRSCYLKGISLEYCSLTYGEASSDESDNPAPTKYLLRVMSGTPAPAKQAVAARFYGINYWVSRLDQGDVDRTVKTFSFLNQLIALQTEASAIGTTQTVLAIGGQ